eukprot:1154337-Pelagomonas_calceolata.AAC.5
MHIQTLLSLHLQQPTWRGARRQGTGPHRPSSDQRRRYGSWGRAHHGSSATWGRACPSAGGSSVLGGVPCCRLCTRARIDKEAYARQGRVVEWGQKVAVKGGKGEVGAA